MSINKKITMSDSPAQDSVILDSGNGSKLILTDNPDADSIPSRALQVETVGPQKYLNLESQTDVVVSKGGRELQLINNANGVDWGDGAICGNVNIQSRWKDINVFTKAEDGRVFIECLNQNGNNQVIEIQTHGTGGTIRLKTNGKIDIEADSIGIQTNNLDMKANSKINMQAPTINLNGIVNASVVNSSFNGNITGSAGFAATAGSAPDGPASPVVVPAPFVPPANPNTGDSESYYGTEGITTY